MKMSGRPITLNLAQQNILIAHLKLGKVNWDQCAQLMNTCDPQKQKTADEVQVYYYLLRERVLKKLRKMEKGLQWKPFTNIEQKVAELYGNKKLIEHNNSQNSESMANNNKKKGSNQCNLQQANAASKNTPKQAQPTKRIQANLKKHVANQLDFQGLFSPQNKTPQATPGNTTQPIPQQGVSHNLPNNTCTPSSRQTISASQPTPTQEMIRLQEQKEARQKVSPDDTPPAPKRSRKQTNGQNMDAETQGLQLVETLLSISTSLKSIAGSLERWSQPSVMERFLQSHEKTNSSRNIRKTANETFRTENNDEDDILNDEAFRLSPDP